LNSEKIYFRKKKLEEDIKSLCKEFEKETDTVVIKIINVSTDNNGCLYETREVTVTSEDEYCIYK